MITLQLKRTERPIEEDDIRLLVLAKAEPFLLIENSRRLLFIGDGISKLIELYNAGKYIQISRYITAEQILAIPADALPEGLATTEQLDQLQEYIDEKYDTLNGDLSLLDEKIDVSKVYSVVCHSSSIDQNKKVQITIPTLDDYTGLTLVVKFDYGNIVDNPILLVNDNLDHNLLSAPMYIGPDPINGVFNWKDGDTLIFTYYDNKMNMAGTSAARTISNWCSENNATLIDGSKIYTGSITADKIATGTITADQIAVGSLPAEVLNSQFSAALNNLSFIEQQAASSRQVVCTCDTAEDEIIKEVYLNGDSALSIGIVNEAPLYGTVLVIRFTYRNTSENGCGLRLVLDGFPFPRASNLVPPIGYYDADNIFHDLQVNNELNWTDGETRVLIFDGSHWIIQPPSGYLRRAAEWCLQNNQTFIQGGSIIAGRISCAQLDAGYIDTSRISLSYYSTDSDGNVENYGGFDHFDGSTGTTTTKGVIMYGSDSENYNIHITNYGIGIDIKNGRISGWNNTWKMDASGGIEIGYSSDDNSYHTGRIRIGNNGYSSSSSSTTYIYGKLNGVITFTNLPTSDPNVEGRIWNDNGTLKVSAG